MRPVASKAAAGCRTPKAVRPFSPPREFDEIGSTESRPTTFPARRSLGRATLCGASLLPLPVTPLLHYPCLIGAL
jgi:hypothetical protein